jgi:hypothetical protein
MACHGNVATAPVTVTTPAGTEGCGDELPSSYPRDMEVLLRCELELFADIEFLVAGCRIPAHRAVLAARSEYFKHWIWGALHPSAEVDGERWRIKGRAGLELPVLETTQPAAFRDVLRYLYTDRLDEVSPGQ